MHPALTEGRAAVLLDLTEVGAGCRCSSSMMPAAAEEASRQWYPDVQTCAGSWSR
jgi:hypothetical protein